jgi:hypothetical protein
MKGLYKVSIPPPDWKREFKNPDGTPIYNKYIAQFHGLNREEIKFIVSQSAEVREAKRWLSKEQFNKELEKQVEYIVKKHERALNEVLEMREKELLKTLKKDREMIAAARFPRPHGIIGLSRDLGYREVAFESKGTKRKKRISKKSKRGKKVKSRRETRGRKKRRKSQLKPKKKRKTKRE